MGVSRRGKAPSPGFTAWWHEMAKSTALAEETREREQRAWELRCRGWTHERISRELGVDCSTVTKSLKRANDRALADLKDKIDAHKTEQTAQLRSQYQQTIRAWELSCKVDEATGLPTAVGDVDFLEEARAIQKDIRSIWGLDAPTKVAATDPTGTKEAGRGFLDEPGIRDMVKAIRGWLPDVALPALPQEQADGVSVPPEGQTPQGTHGGDADASGGDA